MSCKKVFDVGNGIGKIVKMEMGEKFTGVWVREERENRILEHYILMLNDTETSLRVGDSVTLKLEMYV